MLTGVHVVEGRLKLLPVPRKSNSRVPRAVWGEAVGVNTPILDTRPQIMTY